MRVSENQKFQSLKNLDPTIYIADNFDMGPTLQCSDMPMRELQFSNDRKQFSAATIKINPINLPIHSDGFETTAETIMHMDMNRIESITILKDASAKLSTVLKYQWCNCY